MATFKSVPIELSSPAGEQPFYRADIAFYGIDHSGPSFEARVFVNNESADQQTPLETSQGYAGSFHVFGHGGCFGEMGHCDVPPGPVSPFDRRSPHQLTPVNKQVIATDAIRRAMDGKETATLTVTVVPVVKPSPLASAEAASDVLMFDELAILTYD